MVFHIVEDIDDYYSHLMHKQWYNKLIICYFTASWCGPCKMISPDIETLGNEATNVLVLKIDVDDYLTVDITAVGSASAPGANLNVIFEYTED